MTHPPNKKSPEGFRLVKCGRFDNIIPNLNRDKSERSQLKRIASRPPQKAGKKHFLPIATDGKLIYKNGDWLDARDYISTLKENEKKNLVVLTKREKYLLFDIEIETNCRIQSFESSFPIFEDIALFHNPKKRIEYMKEKLRWLESKGIKTSSIGNHNSAKNQHKTARRIRFKNRLDMWFAFSNPAGIQEVFKTHEFRNDRVIVALDYNSMYPSCMEGDFPDPRKLKYYDFSKTNCAPEDLPNGIYRVQLMGFNNETFKNIHPFKYKKSNNTFLFKGTEKITVECLLHKHEIDAYRAYFNDVRIIEGIASNHTIRHPLSKEAKRLFNEMKNYKKQGATTHYNLVKSELQSLYSATSIRKYKTILLEDADELSRFLSRNLFIKLEECKNQKNINKLLNNKYISASSYKNRIKARYINLDSDFNLLSLSTQIVSNARVKMINMIAHILQVSSAEICYVNTDSIHVSIQKKYLDTLIEHLSPYISENMGDLKIQCISEKGLWLDVGRYWLINEGNVVQYKNKTFNHKKNTNPFTRFRKIKKAHYAQAFSYTSCRAVTIENSLTFGKRMIGTENLDHSNLERYDFDEVKNLIVAGETYIAEEAKSLEMKLNLLNRVASN